MTKAFVNFSRASMGEAATTLAERLVRAGWRVEANYAPGEPDCVDIVEDGELVSISWDEAKRRTTPPPPSVDFKLLTGTATLPTRGSPGAAGLDLYMDGGDVICVPGCRMKVHTGISVRTPDGCYGRIAPRSGMSDKGFDVSAGVIDADYRGELMVLLSLHTSATIPRTLKRGDRIAQLIFERCGMFEPAEVAALDATERGFSGFGSTGG